MRDQSTQPVLSSSSTDVVGLSAYLNDTCELRAAGEIRCWGYSYGGSAIGIANPP